MVMVVDTSALIAFILDEDDADRFEDALGESSDTIISVANFLEAAIVLARQGLDADVLLDPTLRRFDIREVEVTVEQGYLARFAYHEFGKGSGHRQAQLRRLLRLCAR